MIDLVTSRVSADIAMLPVGWRRGATPIELKRR